MTLQDRVNQLVATHGSYRAAARVLQVDQGYLYRLGDGKAKSPGVALLRRMGLKQTVTYSLIKKD